MRTVKYNSTVEEYVKNNKTGRATIRDYKGGRVDLVWGKNEKMFNDQVICIKIRGKEAYVSTQDLLAVARNV